LIWIHCTATKGSASATSIAYRKHDAVTEPVKGIAAIVGFYGKASLDYIIGGYAFSS